MARCRRGGREGAAFNRRADRPSSSEVAYAPNFIRSTADAWPSRYVAESVSLRTSTSRSAKRSRSEATVHARARQPSVPPTSRTGTPCDRCSCRKRSQLIADASQLATDGSGGSGADDDDDAAASASDSEPTPPHAPPAPMMWPYVQTSHSGPEWPRPQSSAAAVPPTHAWTPPGHSRIRSVVASWR